MACAPRRASRRLRQRNEIKVLIEPLRGLILSIYDQGCRRDLPELVILDVDDLELRILTTLQTQALHSLWGIKT